MFELRSSLPAPFWEGDGVALYHGDCRDIVPHLGWVDAVITDPPYGETELEWDTWPIGWVGMMTGVCKSLWCFGSMRMFLEHASEFQLWNLSQDIVWEKHNGSGFATDRFRRVHEHALHWYRGYWSEVFKETPRVPRQGPAKKIPKRSGANHLNSIGVGSYVDDGLRLQTSVIYAESCHGNAVNETQKPEQIVAPLLEYSVPPGGIVMDPFAGSGTVLSVARSQGKRAIGIEVRKCQCIEIVKRLSQRVLDLAPGASA